MAVTVAFAVSFTTALQRTYLRAWRRPPGGGMRNKGRGLVWLGGIFGLLSFLSIVRSFTGSTGSWALGIVVSVGLWWWTAHIMLRGEVRWRPLLPTAAVTGVGVWLYTLAANVWMPANVANNFVQFGAFGIALSFVTWFTGMSFIIVAAAAVAPSLADGDDRTRSMGSRRSFRRTHAGSAAAASRTRTPRTTLGCIRPRRAWFRGGSDIQLGRRDLRRPAPSRPFSRRNPLWLASAGLIRQAVRRVGARTDPHR